MDQRKFLVSPKVGTPILLQPAPYASASKRLQGREPNSKKRGRRGAAVGLSVSSFECQGCGRLLKFCTTHGPSVLLGSIQQIGAAHDGITCHVI